MDIHSYFGEVVTPSTSASRLSSNSSEEDPDVESLGSIASSCSLTRWWSSDTVDIPRMELYALKSM